MSAENLRMPGPTTVSRDVKPKMRFFKPTLKTLLPSALLIVFAVLPVLILRYTFYTLLAVPLMPLIRQLGWVYHDKPWFLTYDAAILTAVAWAAPLFCFCVCCAITRQEGDENDHDEMGDATDRSGNGGLCDDGCHCDHRLVLWPGQCGGGRLA